MFIHEESWFQQYEYVVSFKTYIDYKGLED